jgi:2-keto-4-pentenoate hydratase/2-oxohepta-3-ene-1,7-dioic acid hydratase in catechol pathway
MKLIRYGVPGEERPGLVDAEGGIRDLSGIVSDIDGEMLSSGGLAKIASADTNNLARVSGSPRLGPCLGNIRNIIAIGLNYSDHAQESSEGADHFPEAHRLDLRS